MVSVTSNFSKALLERPQPSVPNSGRVSPDVSKSTDTPIVRLAASVLSNERLASSLSEQQQKANETINVLKQAKNSLVTDRKATALQKLELARKKLEFLRSFGGDPKAIARQAKQIAEEIRAAAREYGGALTSEGGGDPSALASQPAEASPAAESETSSITASAATAQAAPLVSTETAAVAGTSSASATGNSPPSSPGGRVSGDGLTKTAANPDAGAAPQKAAQTYKEAAQGTRKSDKAADERETLQKFKDAAREAKRLIEDAARKLKAKNVADPDAADAEHTEAGLDQEIQNLENAVQAQQLDTTVADAGLATGAPAYSGAALAINILA